MTTIRSLVERDPSAMEFGIAHALWLEGKAGRVHSQFGEDGFLAAIFERIGEGNRWCLEVGAGNGVTYSATKPFRDRGWSAVLIEQDDEKFKRLCAASSDRDIRIANTATPTKLAAWLDMSDVPRLDLAIIDIDNEDYFLWRDTKGFQPRVLVIEQNINNPLAECERGKGVPGQAGRVQLRKLAEERGYELVAETMCNLIFVDREELK